MKKLLLVLVMSILLGGFLFASGGAENQVDVGIVLPTKEEPRWLQDEARFRKVLKNTNYSIEVLFSEGKSSTEKANVEALVAKGIKVLILCPQDGAAAAAAVELAKKEGVSVISYDRLITGTDKVDYYSSFDSVDVGRKQGQYLVDQAGNRTGLDLYLYAGANTDNNAFLFFEGAWDVLQPHIQSGKFVIKNSSKAVRYQNKKKLSIDERNAIVDQITTNWDNNVSTTLAQNNITAAGYDGSNDVYLLVPNDGGARAIHSVFNGARGNNDTQIYVTGQDAEKESIISIIDGKQSMTILKDVRILSEDAVNMAVDIIEGKPIKTTTTYNNGVKDVPTKGVEVITVVKENIKKEIIDSGYYKKSDISNYSKLQ